MYYNRTISKSFSALIEDEGELRWLFDFVKNRNDLDFLIGKNTSKEWISVYRGLSRFLTILSTPNSQIIKIGGAKAYNTILPRLYGERNISNRFDTEIEFIINEIEDNPKFDKYYKNKKEGYYQNKLSRKFGICGNFSDEFVIMIRKLSYVTQIKMKKIMSLVKYNLNINCYKNTYRILIAQNMERILTKRLLGMNWIF